MLSEAFKRINDNLRDWHKGLESPEEAQEIVINSLLEDYANTEYGKQFLARDLKAFQKKYPLSDYGDFKPWLNKVIAGEWWTFLPEPPITWVMTRGTTGRSKILPVTKRHLEHIIKGGSRAILKYITSIGSVSTLMGGVLNLQFPSNISSMNVKGKKITYGFSSGTYAKLNPMLGGLHLLPRQEEIDALNTGLSSDDWNRRYEFIYNKTKDEDVFTLMGVAPIQTGFAYYLKKRYGVFPKDIWGIKVIFSTSVSKIQTRYKGILQRMYGDVPVVEMYTATEGAFGQQADEFPYFIPNYDLYFFEVKQGKRIKGLHELKRGEWGQLIVSTPILPRYLIGDLIECMGDNYFRVFGRDRVWSRLEHLAYRALFRWFI